MGLGGGLHPQLQYQQAQLSKGGRATIHVAKAFAKSLKVIRNYTVE